jgi:hypothetical protein
VEGGRKEGGGGTAGQNGERERREEGGGRGARKDKKAEIKKIIWTNLLEDFGYTGRRREGEGPVHGMGNKDRVVTPIRKLQLQI